MDALQDEVESLEAILMDDVRISRNQKGIPEVIETTVLPLVGEDSEQQYVCVTLQVIPTPGYPDVSPEFKLLRPRGLDDTRLESIKAACYSKLEESLGFPVVFDLIEVVREHLTGSNLPSGQCVICLYGFSDGDEFTRTECFHYLHSYCLARHLNAARRNYQEEYDKLPAWLQKTTNPFLASCPVCREIIKDESDSLKCAMPPAELQNAPDFKLTRELRELQQRMASLYLQQKSRGAIIDVEAESGSVISIETEEEMRRRLQRKNDEAANVVTEGNNCNKSGGAGSGGGGSGSGTKSGSESPESGSGLLATEHKDSTSSNPSVSTNFAPVIQQTQRITNEPTNNNYHHNRRHYRGGRRHQHHHHHHHHQNRGDRERERHEHYNNHSSSASHSNGSSAGSGAASATSSVSNNTSSKQTKAQMAGNTHTR